MKKTIVGEIVPGEPLRILAEEVDWPFEEKALESDVVEPPEEVYRVGANLPFADAGDLLVCWQGDDATVGDVVIVTSDDKAYAGNACVQRWHALSHPARVQRGLPRYRGRDLHHRAMSARSD